MKRITAKRIFVLSNVLTSLIFTMVLSTSSAAQSADPLFALQRGYRTGYSDGYMAGYRDIIDSAKRDIEGHADFRKADRAYNKDYGRIDDYRDGYRQGFEAGYNSGYDRKGFESTLPTGLKRKSPTTTVQADRQDIVAEKQIEDRSATSRQTESTASQTTVEPVKYQTISDSVIVIPRDTELILELQETLSTESNREGDRFTARITAPSELVGATVEGRVSKSKKPGRIKRQSEMLLTFDRIILADDRWANFGASLTEVLAVKGDNIKRVDNEGTAIGQTSMKRDLIKVGGATGAGALVGGLVGGPVGVAVGAGVGAAFGVGAVVIERGKHIRLSQNQQLRIKTSHETRIR